MTEHVSALDLFTIGIGPSSSHTVGPMRAAAQFNDELRAQGLATQPIRVTLFGSLGATGIGHGTKNAILAGLEGHQPETCDPEYVRSLTENPNVEFIFEPRTHLPRHSNAMKFECVDFAKTFYSIGGGFIESDDRKPTISQAVPYPYQTADELLEICERESLTIAQVGMANEQAQRPDRDVVQELKTIWHAMKT